ncbi:MAG TPA: tRNA-dihydrouridine synthase family protein, partial [Candidatus Paceibacterota bacterium]|nr:tRNA-dihydrouridine synthase family protein [Candidatus Paceibacterota bacterium]
EHPIVAQIFGSNPDTIAYAAKLAEQLGFDGVDINMGCPDSSIEKQGAGAAMIKTPERAQEVIRAAQGATSLPISVKTRIGYNTVTMDEWLPKILEMKPAALTVHLRTRKEMSLVPAHWELMAQAVALRDKHSPETLIIGNGDVKDLADAEQKAKESGADGIMLGRAIFGNPWLFAGRRVEDTPPAERIAALLALARAYEDLKPRKSFHILKKHVKAFVTGFDGAAELRAKMMETESADELASVIAAHPL